MTNPTLIGSSETVWAGWSVTELMESLLATRGLTLSASTTGRVAATTADQNEARARLQRAATLLHSKFPNVWSRRSQSITWTAGDHSVVLAANLAWVHNVYADGVALYPMAYEDYIRFIQADSSGGGFKGTWGETSLKYYFIPGISNVGVATNDYRLVLRLVPSPVSVTTVIVDYTAKSPDFAAADDAKTIELDNLFVEWLLHKARSLWAVDSNDGVTMAASKEAMEDVERTIFLHLEGTDEYPSRMRWTYPTLPKFVRQ